MLCPVCKGKGLCGLERCPIIARFSARATTTPVTGYSGSAPAVFIRSSGYPAVRGGPLLIGASRPWLTFPLLGSGKTIPALALVPLPDRIQGLDLID